jgi:hypothetical protein
MSETATASPSASSWSEIPQTVTAVICHRPEDYGWRMWRCPALVQVRH